MSNLWVQYITVYCALIWSSKRPWGTTAARRLARLGLRYTNINMAFTFAALSYIVALIVDAFLIFFAIFHVSAVLCVPCHAWVSACPGVMAHQRGVAAAGGPGGGGSPARGASATGPPGGQAGSTPEGQRCYVIIGHPPVPMTGLFCL